MYVCMYVCMCMCVCVSVCVCVCVCTRACACVYVSASPLYNSTAEALFTRAIGDILTAIDIIGASAGMYVCGCVLDVCSMYVCMCMYVCTYMHESAYRSFFLVTAIALVFSFVYLFILRK